MPVLKLKKLAGSFGENKDVARDIRTGFIMINLKENKEVILDFDGMTGATQSFIHALISEAIRTYGDDVFDLLIFKNCSPAIREVINIVADYMEET